MNQQDTEARLSKLTGIREDVIHAANISENKLAEFFNKATEAAKWNKIGDITMLTGIAGFLTNLVTASNPSLSAVATVAMVAALGGLGSTFYASHKRNKNVVNGEIMRLAQDRLVALDRQDRGQAPEPAL